MNKTSLFLIRKNQELGIGSSLKHLVSNSGIHLLILKFWVLRGANGTINLSFVTCYQFFSELLEKVSMIKVYWWARTFYVHFTTKSTTCHFGTIGITTRVLRRKVIILFSMERNHALWNSNSFTLQCWIYCQNNHTLKTVSWVTYWLKWMLKKR